MKQNDLLSVLDLSTFWNPDRFGHYKNANAMLRIKIQKTSVRVERKVNGEWFNSVSDYYKNLAIVTGKSGNPALKVKNRVIKLYE